MKKCFDPKFQRPALSLLTAGGLLCLQACGGGGGGGVAAVIDPGGGGAGGGQGIIGTGLTSSGTIDGTGSVFVNGVRFDIDDAEIAIDGETAREDDLGPGMAVRIKGTVAEDGKSGKATRVDVSTSLEGPVSAIKRNADNSSARLTILGQTVIAERTSTVFEGVRFGALATGMALEVSGYRDPNGRLRATRVEVDDDPNEVQLEGVVGALNGLNFRIGSQPVDASAADLGDLPNSALSAGLRVSVEGRLQNGVIVADDIDSADDLSRGLEANAAITLLGSVSGLSGSTFVVEGLTVDTSNAQLQTGGLPLSNGSIVEVQGVWDGRRVAARSVTRRRGRIEFEGSLASVASATRSLVLRIGNDTVSVATDERTLFDDERDDIKFLKLSNLATGDFLRVEALSMGDRLLATRVDREDDDEDTVLQAPLQSFVNGLSVTLQGVTFNVTRAEFENVDDKDINASAFFANLKTGALLRVTDKAPADGFAEEVEFEFATALDGDREFEDDDEERIDPARLPQRVRDYIAANFPGRGIAFAKRDDDEIEVYLTNGTEVSFDLNGRFIETDDDDDDERDDDRDDDKDDDRDDDKDNERDDDRDDDKDNERDDDKDDGSDDSKDDDSDDSKDDSSDDSKDDDSDDSKDDDSDDSKDDDSDDSKDDGSDDSKDDDSDDSKDDGSDDSKDDDSDDSGDSDGDSDSDGNTGGNDGDS